MADFDQRPTCRDAYGEINSEHGDSRATDGSQTEQEGFVITEVRSPQINSWIEKAIEFARFRIESSNVGTFKLITSPAAKSEIRKMGYSTVLTRNNVIKNVGEAGRKLRAFGSIHIFRQQAGESFPE